MLDFNLNFKKDFNMRYCNIHINSLIKFSCSCNLILCKECLIDHHHENLSVRNLNNLKEDYLSEMSYIKNKLEIVDNLIKKSEDIQLQNFKLEMKELTEKNIDIDDNENISNIIYSINENKSRVLSEILIQRFKNVIFANKNLERKNNNYSNKTKKLLNKKVIDEASIKSSNGNYYLPSLKTCSDIDIIKDETNEKNIKSDYKLSVSEAFSKKSKAIDKVDNNSNEINFSNLKIPSYNSLNNYENKENENKENINPNINKKEIKEISGFNAQSKTNESNFSKINLLNNVETDNVNNRKISLPNTKKHFKKFKKDCFDLTFNYLNEKNFDFISPKIKIEDNKDCLKNSETVNIVCITCRERFSLLKDQALWRRRCDLCSENYVNNNN
jgi:hypothetical protein